MLRIEAERICLRDHQIGDLNAYHAWISDPEITQFLTWGAKTREESQARLAECLRENGKEDRTKYYFAVLLKDEGRIIGDAGFTVADRAKPGGSADLGCFLLKPYWRNGYATEALQAMIRHCFTVLKLHQVTAGCDARNTASERLMKRCGMTRKAHPKKHQLQDSKWRDRLEYALAYEDWTKCYSNQAPLDIHRKQGL